MRVQASSRAFVDAWPAIAIAVLLLLPFLGKAFTIDDTLFLEQAKHLQSDALHPTAFDTVWTTTRQRMSAIMPSGPAMAYLLWPCVAAGAQEWIAHALELALFAMALVATAALARRLGATAIESRVAALLLAATPAALAMAGTALPDVPAMAFGVLGVERALAWKQSGRWHQGVVAAFAIAAAILCRPHLTLVVLPALLICIGDWLGAPGWRQLRARVWAPMAIGVGLALAAIAVTRDPLASTTAQAEAADRFMFVSVIPANTVAFFTHWSLALPFAVPWLALHPRRVLTRPILIVTALAAGVVQSASPIGRLVVVAVAAGIGAAALWDVVRDAFRRRSATELALAVWLTTPFVVVPYLHLPSKYLLAAAPAAAILVAHALTTCTPSRARAVLATSMAAGCALGVLILRADMTMAGIGRTAARELVAPQVASGRNVWFAGHWGFQWYVERAGARPLTVEGPYPAPGDRLITSQTSEWNLDAIMPQRRQLDVRGDDRPGGRIMSRAAGAGFYSNVWGDLPWSWGHDPAEICELWEVR